MKIAKGMRARVKVLLTIKGGDVLEKNVVEYIHGAGTMLPGIEQVLEGLEKGASKKGTLPAAKAFGDPKFEIKKSIPRAEFPGDADLEVGSKFVAGGPNNTEIVLEVKKVTEDTVECVAKHALADKDLDYELEVMQVSDPKPPPLPAQALELEDAE